MLKSNVDLRALPPLTDKHSQHLCGPPNAGGNRYGHPISRETKRGTTILERPLEPNRRKIPAPVIPPSKRAQNKKNIYIYIPGTSIVKK